MMCSTAKCVTDYNCVQLVLCCLLLMCCHCCGVLSTATHAQSSIANQQPYVCGNIDIRNSVEQFSKLERCTVVEGYVQIVLIDKGTPKDYENLTFPNLREITDYLLLFRAFGLPSLGKLFPKLTVIRGRILFHDFALVVYEMLQLQQLALTSLTDIVRGAVRIEKNPHLCFVETIDWNRIAKAAKNGHFIHENKPRQQCPTCGSECPVERARTSEANMIGDMYGRLCWNTQVCQKRSCPDDCEQRNMTCTSDGYCCDDNCLSGCTINSTGNHCFACRWFTHNGKCERKCPQNTFEYLGRRCLTKEQCLNESKRSSNLFLKPIEGKCTPECPKGYIENANDKYSCTRCEGFCPKVCQPSPVTNIASAQNLKGCTVINGSLEIYIQSGSGNIIRELEENLQHLEEIKGFLKVARSFPLITLNFLKKLRVIHGEVLERGMYSFLVLDNPNLQDLWTFDENSVETIGEHKLEIKRGKIFFHINPKLCYNKIKYMENYVYIPDHKSPWDPHDVSPHSNGDKVACEVSKLNVTIWAKMSEMVGIEFQNFKQQMDDQRSLLGYLIYYRETQFQNVSIFDGRDACSTNIWKVDDFEATDDAGKLRHIIPHLKPYTQYALYIKTYTIASETKGAQSDILYFTTLPDTPSQPKSITARPQSSASIFIEWEEPTRTNGLVTHYVVTGTRDEDSSDFIIQRDYCSEPVAPDAPKKIIIEDEPKTNVWTKNKTNDETKDKENCCSCKKPFTEDEVERRISFEDYLINAVYVKRNSNVNFERRKKREIDSSQPQQEFETKQTSNATVVPKATVPPPNFYHRVDKNKFVVISNLSHFTEYTIEVRACQDTPPDKDKDKCSLKAMTSVRTLPLGGADDIDESNVIIVTDNSTMSNFVTVKWDEPFSPNGLIVSYTIEYKRVTSESLKQTSTPDFTRCISRHQYMQNKAGWPLVELLPGNYSLRLRANSLAGWGNWTKSLYFQVPDQPTHGYEMLFYIVIPVAAIVCVSFILLTGIVYFKYRKSSFLDYVSVNPEYISAGLVYKPDPQWEVPREKVQVGRELGQGSFGMVYEGTYYKENCDAFKCAVKTVNEHATIREQIEFLQEADVMKSFVDCHHVVKLLGIVSDKHPYYVLMEIMLNGDLRSYLRVHRPDDEDCPDAKPPTLAQLYQMAVEIADGMAYLASRKFVHRDLAARNCMVAEDLTVKIGDFGMTRDIYETDYYRKGGKGLLPVRWMAPESLKDGVFTTYSDVWSYGVVLWEMVTLASQPYQGLANEAVLKYVVEGGRMERPENCPQKLWDLMLSCWNRNPKSRPNFIEVIETLLPDANETFHEQSYYTKHVTLVSKHKSSQSSLHDDVSTPLKQLTDSVNCEDDRVCISDSNEVHFFPLSRTIAIPETDRSYDIDQIDEFSSLSANDSCSANNKQLNHNYSSDGSKGSKISSTTSNGSITNGYAVHCTPTVR